MWLATSELAQMATMRLGEIIIEEVDEENEQKQSRVSYAEESSTGTEPGKVRKGAGTMTATVENQLENEFMHLALRKQLSYR